jgi:hypothetical protein
MYSKIALASSTLVFHRRRLSSSTCIRPQQREIKKIALSIPTDLGRPFATWSLAKLADYLVAEGVVTDISHEGLRQLLREEGVSFQAVRTWKRSNDPNFETKKNRILELYELADAGKAVVICLDEFGPLNLQPQPGGKAWAPLKKPRRIRATYTRPHGARHMLGAYDVTRDRLYGHVKKRKTRVEFLAFCRYVRSLHPPEVRLHFIPDNFSPHLGDDVRRWAHDNNVEPCDNSPNEAGGWGGTKADFGHNSHIAIRTCTSHLGA